MTDGRGVWVYAVARGIDEAWFSGLPGLGGEPVRTLAGGGLAAAVTSVSLAEFGAEALRRRLEDMDWLSAAAVAHHQVIETVAARQPAIPMRLATVCRDDERVTAMLAGRRADFTAALDQLTARAEWGLKVYPAAAGTEAASRTGCGGTGAGGPRPPGAGTAYLERRRRERTAAQDARRAALASAETIHDSLGRCAAAAQLRAPQSPQLTGQPQPMIMNAAYLVDERRAEAFAAAVAELAARHPAVRVELTGPWPPYSFAAVDLPGDRP